MKMRVRKMEYEKLGNRVQLADAIANVMEQHKLGKIYQDNGEYEKAVGEYEKGAIYSKEIFDILEQFVSTGNKCGETFEYVEEVQVPKIIRKIIEKRKKDIVRVAAVQLNYELSDTFPYQIPTEKKEEMKQKIMYVIEAANKEDVNILCLPELCTCEELLSQIRGQCKNMIIIAGTYYDKENHNVCPLVIGSAEQTLQQLKIFPSNFEKSIVGKKKMCPGESLYNYYTHFGSFSILICRDFVNCIFYLRGKTDMVFVPSYNPANETFHKSADNHVTDSPSYVIISNCSKYGGTSIFGRVRYDYFVDLVQAGYKEKHDKTYKLCEIEKEKEGIIMADLNLSCKSPLLQTPVNPEEDIITVNNINIVDLRYFVWVENNSPVRKWLYLINKSRS